jgi:hypothetical protein
MLQIVQMIITETMIDIECAQMPGLGRLQAYRRITDRAFIERTSRAELQRIGAAWRSNGDNSPAPRSTLIR